MYIYTQVSITPIHIIKIMATYLQGWEHKVYEILQEELTVTLAFHNCRGRGGQ